MKAKFAALSFLVAASVLAFSAAVVCPSGVDLYHNGTYPNNTKDCSYFCVKFKCGALQAVQYGCKDDAFNSCPLFKNASSDLDVLGYCELNADGDKTFYYPSCYGRPDDWTCNGTEAAANETVFFKNCTAYGQDSGKESAALSNTVSCPGTGEEEEEEGISCQACATYECNQKNKTTGCVENFFQDCSELQEEINAIKAFNQSRMYYCNDKVSFWSGCQGEGSWKACMAEEKPLKKIRQEEVKLCEGRKPGTAIWGPRPETTTVPTTTTLSTQASGDATDSCSSEGYCHANGTLEDEVPCPVGAIYTCNKYVKQNRRLVKQNWTSIGCVEDFFNDCWIYKQEIFELHTHRLARMYFCNDNAEFFSGCEVGRKDGLCAEPGSWNNMTIQEEIDGCKKRKPGIMIIGNGPKPHSAAGRSLVNWCWIIAAAALFAL